MVQGEDSIKRSSRDTYPESCITKCTTYAKIKKRSHPQESHQLALPPIIWFRHLRRPYVNFPVSWYEFVNFWREIEQNDKAKMREG